MRGLMKIRMFIFLLCMLTFASMAMADGILDVPFCEQEQNNWCWAGSSWTILHYYGEDPSQCQIVNYAFNSNSCCDSPSNCNEPNGMCTDYQGLKGIYSILQNWNTPTDCVNDALSKDQFAVEIDNCHPFVIFWQATGTGHFVVGEGVEGNTVYIMDPWYGEGKKSGTYEWVMQPDDRLHWGQTLKTTRTKGDCGDPDSDTEPTDQCVTDDNNAHISQGRAYQCGSFNQMACAVGSGDNLGFAAESSAETTSVQETAADYWESVESCP